MMVCVSADDKIGPEGMQDLFDHLDVDPLDITALIFAWKLKAKVPFEFSRDEFMNGCIALKADSMDKLKKAMRTFILYLYPMFDHISWARRQCH